MTKYESHLVIIDASKGRVDLATESSRSCDQDLGVYKDEPLRLSFPLILNLLCNPLLQLVSWILSNKPLYPLY